MYFVRRTYTQNVFVLQVTFLMMPLEIGWNVTVTWQAGDAACRIMAFFRTFGIYLSSFVIVSISLDRSVRPVIHSAVSRRLDTYPPVPAIPIIHPAVSVWQTIHPNLSVVTFIQPTVSVWATIHPSLVMIIHPSQYSRSFIQLSVVTIIHPSQYSRSFIQLSL
jgi:hypothetical protein